MRMQSYLALEDTTEYDRDFKNLIYAEGEFGGDVCSKICRKYQRASKNTITGTTNTFVANTSEPVKIPLLGPRIHLSQIPASQ